MIKIELSKEEANEIQTLRYSHPDPVIQKRLDCIWLKHLQYKNTEIAKILNIHHDTVTDYVKRYQKGGIPELEKKNYRKDRSELNLHKTSILEDFTKNPPQTISQACMRIETLTGIKRKPTQVGRFMKKIGLKRLKCGYIPGKADPVAQEEFLETTLMPELEEAAKGGKKKKKPFFSWIVLILSIQYL
jgi:transposase